MGKITFQEVAEPVEGPHPSDFECSCETPIGDRSHRLAISEGQVSLMCSACGNGLPYVDWWGEEAVEMEPIDVRLVVHTENEGTDDVYCWVEVLLENQP